MSVLMRCRGRDFTEEDIVFIQELIAEHPRSSRRALSAHLAEAWDWRQENGQLRDMVCRTIMLALHRAGHIELPPSRQRARNNIVDRPKIQRVTVDRTLLRGSLADLRPLELRQVRGTAEVALFDGLVDQHHYLGYTRMVGEHLKYVVHAGARPVACLGWTSAPRHLGPRDRFIGWSAEARRCNIRLLAYNTRFLILPWVEVPHLASHLLARAARQISRDWERVYGHGVHYLETFVDPARFRGTCYRAANWTSLGRTQGLGKDARSKVANRAIKEVLGYPLTPRFRELLGALP